MTAVVLTADGQPVCAESPSGAWTLVAAEVLPLDRQVAAGAIPSVRRDGLRCGQVAIARDPTGALVSVQAGPGGWGLGAPAGTFATSFGAPPDGRSLPLPSALDPLVAAAGVSGALSAWLALDAADLSPGDTVVVTGAAGAVGAAAVQLAATRGLQVVAVSSRPHAVPPGAADVVATPPPGLGAAAVIDTSTGVQLAETIRSGGRRCRHVVVGYVAPGVVQLVLPLLLVNEHLLVGFNAYAADPVAFGVAHAGALEALATGTVTARPSTSYSFDQVTAAYAADPGTRALLLP